ncbi:MAG: alpha/beta fold hydrolase [Actinomycetota bacterium]
MDARQIDLGGPVHLVADDGPGHGPTFLLIHGLGGHHTNWLALAPHLAKRGRVIAPDLPGFGLTPLDGRSASVTANRAFVSRLIREHVGGPVVLCGNSMGGLISILEAVAEPHLVSGLVLIDPALPRRWSAAINPAVAASFATNMLPRVGEAVLERRRLDPERVAMQTLRLCTVDMDRVPAELVQAALDMARAHAPMPWAVPAFLEAARSLVRLLARRRRVLGLIAAISTPTLLIAGVQDRLVPISSVRDVARIRRDWDVVELPHCGHVPMMEDAPRVAEEIERWLAGPCGMLIAEHDARAAEKPVAPPA